MNESQISFPAEMMPLRAIGMYSILELINWLDWYNAAHTDTVLLDRYQKLCFALQAFLLFGGD